MPLRDLIIGALLFSCVIIGLSMWAVSVQDKTGLGLEPLSEKGTGTFVSDAQDYANQTQEKLKSPNQPGILGAAENSFAFLSGAYSIVVGSIDFLFKIPPMLSNIMTDYLQIPPVFSAIILAIIGIFILYELLSVLMGKTL